MDGWSTLARGVKERELAAARREGVIGGEKKGVIKGLERASEIVGLVCHGPSDRVSDAGWLRAEIRAEIAKLKSEAPRTP